MNFWCLKAGGFLKQELSTERWILRWILFGRKNKGKSAKKIRQKIRRLESKNPPGVNPPLRPPHRAPPPHNPPPLGRATPSPEPSGLGLAAPVCLCRWLVRSTSAFVEVHILLHNQSLEGCIRSSGQVLNEERMQLSQGLAMASQRCMHCEFLVLKFGP